MEGFGRCPFSRRPSTHTQPDATEENQRELEQTRVNQSVLDGTKGFLQTRSELTVTVSRVNGRKNNDCLNHEQFHLIRMQAVLNLQISWNSDKIVLDKFVFVMEQIIWQRIKHGLCICG